MQQAEQLKGIFNKAFKIDSTALSNLKQIESTMKEINKLSRRSQDSLLGGGSGNTGNINNEQQDIKKFQMLCLDFKIRWGQV